MLTATTAVANATPLPSSGPPNLVGGSPANTLARGRWRRVVRALLGLSCFGFGCWALLPPLSGVSTEQAIVNAPLVTIRSPLEGTVKLVPGLPSPATANDADESIEVTAYFPPESRLETLRGEVAALKARAEASQEQLRTLSDLATQLETSARHYQEASLRRLEQSRNATRASVEQMRLTQKQREVEHESASKLVGSGGVSRQEFTTTRLAADAARQGTAHETFLLARIEEELKALKQGIFLGDGDGRADLPYSTQRRHELAIRRAEYQATLRNDQSRLLVAEAQLAEEESRLSRRTQFRAVTPGVVWRRQVADGSTVILGTPLVDYIEPSSLFIDAVVPESYLAWLHPGDEAVVRFTGTGERVTAVVKQIPRRELPWATPMLAVEPAPIKPHEVHVVLAFSGDQASTVRADSVGRSLEVSFRRDLNAVFAQYFGVFRP